MESETKMGCVLTDTQLEDLYQVTKNFNAAHDDAEFIFVSWVEDIEKCLHELKKRREHPDPPDAEELLDLERLDREAQEDALLDTRPLPPYEHFSGFQSGGFMDSTTYLLGETDEDDPDPEW